LRTKRQSSLDPIHLAGETNVHEHEIGRGLSDLQERGLAAVDHADHLEARLVRAISFDSATR
jgi:hypothetical protein